MLDFARDRKVAADRAEADVLLAAVTWAEQHPPESIAGAAMWAVPGAESELALAGKGAPLVAEFCVAEFALAIGRSTDSGRAVIAHAVELKYRLPRHWARVQSGTLEPWRARRVAAATLGLSKEAAQHVDVQLAPFAHKVGPAQLDRLVEEAIARFMPDTARENAERAADRRHVTFHHQQVSFNGTTFVEAELDLADALDLDAAITQGAEQLKIVGSDESLDVRRAMAAGDLARRQLTLDLQPGTRTHPQLPSGRALRPPRRGRHRRCPRRARPGACGEPPPGLPADQVRTWCANPDTQITVKPVIDLDGTHPGRRLRDPRPAPRASSPARRHLRLPVVLQAVAILRHRPPGAVRRRRTHRE